MLNKPKGEKANYATESKELSTVKLNPNSKACKGFFKNGSKCMSMRVQGVVDIYCKRICMGHKIENIGLRRIMWSLVTQVGNIVLLKQSLEFC